jgi:wobble nucleotide-excising tRNase
VETAATAKKETVSEADAAQALESVNRLENQKARFEPLAQDLVGKVNAIAERRSELDREKGDLKKAIDEHAARVVGKYQSGINDYLKFFGSDIRIEAAESRFPSGRAIIQYALKAHGYEIPLGCSEDQPCFETVLSEGDKNLLALSFFLARLKDHQSLDGRSIVFDDPVNSLGSGRRILVEEVIRELRGRRAQIIVLTHDERLAALMHRDRAFRDMVCMQVERSRSGSRLSPWDIERAIRSQYVSDYLTLADYVNEGGDHGRAASCIRPYVEQRLRHLYPGPPFTTRDSLGEMIKTIRESKPGSRVHALKDKLPELEAINEAALPSHHATDDVVGMSKLTPDSVRIFAEKALSVL